MKQLLCSRCNKNPRSLFRRCCKTCVPWGHVFKQIIYKRIIPLLLIGIVWLTFSFPPLGYGVDPAASYLQCADKTIYPFSSYNPFGGDIDAYTASKFCSLKGNTSDKYDLVIHHGISTKYFQLWALGIGAISLLLLLLAVVWTDRAVMWGIRDI